MTGSQVSPASSSQPPRPGLVEVFTGNGKGKTSAALGIALRALGHEHRVHVIFFMKGEEYSYGERQIIPQLTNISFDSFGEDCFADPANIKPEEKEQAEKALKRAGEVIASGDYDVVILDEINVAVAWKLLEIDRVLELIKNKPNNVELILTGRYADARLIDAADLVTEMVEIKHPYSQGLETREGIDY